MASLAVGDEEVEAEEQEKVKSGKEKLLRLNELPDDLLKYVLEFFRGDFKTLSRFLQTCGAFRNKYNSSLVALKCLRTEIYDIRDISDETKQQLYKSYFCTTFSYRRIGAKEAKHLAEALKESTSLTAIFLSENNIGDEGGKAIGEALKVNTSLTKIYLSYNKIGDEGRKAIIEASEVNTSCDINY